MAVQHLITAFDQWRARGERLVLATIVETLGSTYSKAGAQMLIDPGGDFEGLLSGGCLEGDLVEHARNVLESGAPRQVTYDMRDEEEDQVWGLGLGCNGAVRIFMQELGPANGYEPFASMAALLESGADGGYAIVIASDDAALPAGSALVDDLSGREHAAEHTGPLAALCARVAADGSRGIHRLGDNSEGPEVFAAALVPIPRVLVLGAGPDAIPVARMGVMLGWRMTVADHRPAYVSRIRSIVDTEVVEVDPTDLGAVLDLDQFDACVVMSHHYLTDRDYLACLAPSRVPFIGMLGPERRRERLFEELGDRAPLLAGRARGPVGLDLGADGADSIALSIVAQIEAVLNGASGGHLS